jgi:lysine-N-methylase
MRKFQCIGPVCEDSCCVGWRVNIDETTYRKYQEVDHPELAPTLDKYVTRNRSNPSPANYAKIKMEASGACPFLGGDKLCSIQKTLGEAYLSHTCSQYPRSNNMTNGQHERAATVSCPEVARLALLNPEPMEFDQFEEEIDSHVHANRSIHTGDVKFANKPQRFFWELRIFTIQVLQHRQLPLSSRLTLLGLFYQKVQEKALAGETNKIPELIEQFMAMLFQDSVKQQLEEVPTNTALQMKLAKEIIDQRFASGVNSSRYMQVITHFLHGIQYVAESTTEQIAERYSEAYTNYYVPFMADHEYILENYLVNYVYKNMFPFTGSKELFDAYVMMVIHYAMIKMLLIGNAGYHKELTIDRVMLVIQSFAKTIEHSDVYLKKIEKLLKENGYTTMAYMSILIKN